MKFCQNHWDTLRQAINTRGLGDMVAQSGEEAAALVASQLKGEKITLEKFDPLMAAHNMIVNNCMQVLRNIGANPLVMMTEDPEHPEWQCPICYLNFLSLEHDKTCTDPNCPKQKGYTFDEWINYAADGAARAAAEMKDGKPLE